MGKFERECVVCHKTFYGNSSNAKFCSSDCRTIHRRKLEQEKNERRKAQRHMKNAIGETKLDRCLSEARSQGLSYAEYQKQKTLLKIARGEL